MKPKSHAQSSSRLAAVYLDRDGVLIEDVHLLTAPEQVRIFPGVPEALWRLKNAGFPLIVVSNQAVVARGMMSEAEVLDLHGQFLVRLAQAGGPSLDAFYFCPHHPNATDLAYRIDCECRKPRPGLLLVASEDMNLDLSGSYVIGDRITDVIAGSRVGCSTILVETGAHRAPPILTADRIELSARPDYKCADVAQAAEWITSHT